MPAPTTKVYWRCPTCGLGVRRQQIARGALGGHALQVLTKQFVGRGHGQNGGAIIWRRRPMGEHELAYVAAAVAKAAEDVAAHLDGEPIAAVEPEALLSTLDDEEAEEVGAAWLADAEAEAARRRDVIASDRERRTRNR